MTRISNIAVCVVATFVLSAVLATSASAALPEYRACVKAPKVGKKETGAYEDKACTKVDPTHEGKYELGPEPTKTKLKGNSAPTVFTAYEPLPGEPLALGKEGEATNLGGPLECGGLKAAGEITGPKETEFTVTYEKCSASGIACGNVKAGTIVTEKLKGELGYEKAAGSPVEVKIGKGRGVWADFACGAREHDIAGEALAVVSLNINVTSGMNMLSFSIYPKTGEPGQMEFNGKPLENPLDNLYEENGKEDEFSVGIFGVLLLKGKDEEIVA
jgi:hypothetical protein